MTCPWLKMTVGVLSALTSLIGSAVLAQPAPIRSAPLIAQKPISLPGGTGTRPEEFDWMATDASLGHVLAAHKGTGTLAAVETRTGKILTSAPAGAVQGVAVDTRDNKVFTGNDDQHQVVVLNRQTLRREAILPMSGPVDAMAYDPKNDRVYADHDGGTEVWVISGKTNKLLTAIPLGGVPEYVQYDATTDRVYQNIKSANTVAVIDPKNSRVVATWSTAPVTSPHGLAIDTVRHRLFIAGPGRLAMLDMTTGRVLASVATAPGDVDQIAFDPGLRRIYCACAGVLSVVQETATGLRLLGNVTDPKGTHSVAVDAPTHTVWICYADAHGRGFLLPYRTQ